MSLFIFLVLLSSTWFLLPCSTLNLNSAEYFLLFVTASVAKKDDEQTSRSCSAPCLPADPETLLFVFKTLLTCDQSVALTCCECVISRVAHFLPLHWVQAVGARVFLVIQWDHSCTFICKRGAWAGESRVSQSQELWVRFPFLAITAWPWGVFWNWSSAHATVGHKKAKPSTLVLCRV